MSEHEHDGIEHSHDRDFVEGRVTVETEGDSELIPIPGEPDPYAVHEHTHGDLPEGAISATHTHDGVEHTHDRDEVGESSDSVDQSEPKRQVPVIVSGVNHGMRDAEEGE